MSVLIEEPKKNYIVKIIQDNEEARLSCDTLEMARRVKVSFENYGKCESITIEEVTA